MPTLPKNVGHSYDSRIVFHSHSTNLPHLNSWIDDLLALSENSLPVTTHPTTENLVQALQRYDAIFRELFRQTSIFSEPITKMLSKSWVGVIKLMEYMVKAYHRYVKHTSNLQQQAQNLLMEKQGQAAAQKVHQEEFDLERAALRARIRNLEAEVESLGKSKRSISNENDRLRRLIDVYINSIDMNNPVWDLMNADETTNANSSNNNIDGSNDIDSNQADYKKQYGFNRKNSIDASKAQLKTLNRLDIEMNETLSGILKEENRQRLLMADLMKLIEKNRAFFEIPSDGSDEMYNSSTRATSSNTTALPTRTKNTITKTAATVSLLDNTLNNSYTNDGSKSMKINNRRRSIFVDKSSKSDFAVQVDYRDEYGVVDDTPQPSYFEHWGQAPAAPLNIKIVGESYPHLLRPMLSSFPMVLRIPPAAWTCQMIMSIYLDKMRVDDLKFIVGHTKDNLPTFVYQYFKDIAGLPAAADVLVSQLLKACEYHMIQQPRVALFASQLGLNNLEQSPSLDVRDTDFILHTLDVLMSHGELVADEQALHSVKAIQNKSKQLKSLLTIVHSDILRSTALVALKQVFDKWLPDNGEEYSLKIRSLPNGVRGAKYVDVDRYIQVLMEPWQQVRINWEDHATHLFHEHCGIFRVLQEAQFANDEGQKTMDAILVQVNKNAAYDCIRRPARIFQMLTNADTAPSDNNDGMTSKPSIPLPKRDGKSSSGNRPKGGKSDGEQGNVNKEPVCEVMDKKGFLETMLIIDPTMDLAEIDSMFEEACDIAHASILRSLETIWLKCEDKGSASRSSKRIMEIREFHPTLSVDEYQDKEFGGSGEIVRLRSQNHLTEPRYYYVNLRTSQTQWCKPYHLKTFRSHDINKDAFVAVLLRRDVFAKCPLIELLHLSPSDLWPEADMFHKQVREMAAKRAEGLNSLRQQAMLSISTNNIQSKGAIIGTDELSSDKEQSVKTNSRTGFRRKAIDASMSMSSQDISVDSNANSKKDVQLENVSVLGGSVGDDQSTIADDHSTFKDSIGKDSYDAEYESIISGLVHNNDISVISPLLQKG
eukprot:gene13380-17942_t